MRLSQYSNLGTAVSDDDDVDDDDDDDEGLIILYTGDTY